MGQAQEDGKIVLKGVVQDARTNEPIPFVNIGLLGTVAGVASDEMQSCGIGKLLLDYIKDKKVSLRLNVYQKNARAISFYQREGFIIQCEGLDEATGEKERPVSVLDMSLARIGEL